jgi:hypothetical protein
MNMSTYMALFWGCFSKHYGISVLCLHGSGNHTALIGVFINIWGTGDIGNMSRQGKLGNHYAKHWELKKNDEEGFNSSCRGPMAFTREHVKLSEEGSLVFRNGLWEIFTRHFDQ